MSTSESLKILCIILSEQTFEESLLLTHITEQLPENIDILCMSNAISSAYVSSNPKRVVALLTENLEDNYHDFQIFMQEAKPDLILLLDLYQYFLMPEEINFQLEWLSDIDVPILALDLFNMLEYQNDELHLKSIKERTLPTPTQTYLPLGSISPLLLKPIPPIQTDKLSGHEKEIPWNSLLEHYAFVKPGTQEMIRKTMNLNEDVKIVTLMLDPSLVNRALDLKLLGFFPILVETLAFYLSQMEGENFQLLIAGFKAPFEITHKLENIQVHHFTHLTEDLYQLLVCGSDLLILQSNWTYAHIDALMANTPTVVFGNSIQQEIQNDEKILTSSFSPHPFLYEMVQLFLEFNKSSSMTPLFQFINYPLKQIEIPPAGFQASSPPYFLADIFNDEETFPFLKTLLCDQEYLKVLQELGNKYLEGAKTYPKLNTIIKQLLNVKI